MSDSATITRLNAALEGRYAIEREIGEGGMAGVYLAHDERHDRSVALKVLKPELAAAVGAARFLAEIETTAKLQHPNILPLFDSGEADGLLFYVMPYVEGESLRDRLDREHQLPVDDAVRIAGELAEALDHAHRHGIVHRDIKPANVLLRDGRPLISDFGIALALSAGGGSRLTETGLSLGTPHYMSPEQVAGDARVGPPTDLWALGCVLYEMLVGEPPYTGSIPQAVLGKIVAEPAPSVRDERRSVPVHVDEVVGKALEKVPADRFIAAEELRRSLMDPSFRHREPSADDPDVRFRRGAVVGASAVAAVALALFVVWIVPGDGSSNPGPLRHLEVPIPEAQAVVPGLLYNVSPRIAMSPDGESFVYAGLVDASESLDSRLYRRRLDQLVSQPIPGTEGGASPFFSPDGRWLAFFRTGGLMRVPAEGGAPLTVVEFGSSGMWGGWWGENDTIYFRPSGPTGLWQVPAEGGAPSLVRPELPRSNFHAALPGGRGILFSDNDEGHVSVRTPTGDTRPLIEAEAAQYADGYLLLWRPPAGLGVGSLLAAPFDLEALERTGRAEPILEQDIPLVTRGGGYRASGDGTLIYVVRDPRAETGSSLVWVDRSGREEPLCSGISGGAPRISPDGGKVAVDGVRVIDLDDCTVQEVSDEGTAPAWSPDGRRLSFQGRNGLHVANAGAAGPDSLLHEAGNRISSVWSPSGDAIVFAETRPAPGGGRVVGNKVVTGQIVLMRLDLPTGAVAALSDSETGPSHLTLPTLSPDGDWIAFAEWDGLRREIHVARLSDDALLGKRRVASDGAYAPVWSRAGGELFFRRGSAVVSVPVSTDSIFRVAGPEDTLFVGPYGRTSPSVSQMFDYDHRRQRFVMVRDNNVPPSVRVVFNWRELLR